MEEEKKRTRNKEVEVETLDEMVHRVKITLNRIQNSSATGPNSISYRFIKTIKDTILREKVLEEVVRNLVNGTILRQ